MHVRQFEHDAPRVANVEQPRTGEEPASKAHDVLINDVVGDASFNEVHVASVADDGKAGEV
jgi:hypothetical protein